MPRDRPDLIGGALTHNDAPSTVEDFEAPAPDVADELPQNHIENASK